MLIIEKKKKRFSLCISYMVKTNLLNTEYLDVFVCKTLLYEEVILSYVDNLYDINIS